MMSKVFGIGFQKTATASLGRALELLGYRLGDLDTDAPITHEALADRAIEIAKSHDAFRGNPWSRLFREMDRAFPGSKFILTLRDTDEWLASIVRHFGRASTPMREFVYGVGFPQGNERIYARCYDDNNRQVLEYFKNRDDDLLVMNIIDGDGWEILCPFLGVDAPGMKFPHRNKARSRDVKRLRRKVRAFVGGLGRK